MLDASYSAVCSVLIAISSFLGLPCTTFFLYLLVCFTAPSVGPTAARTVLIQGVGGSSFEPQGDNDLRVHRTGTVVVEMPISVFIAYADSYVGEQLVRQFEGKPQLFTIQGCTWEEDAAHALAAKAIEKYQLQLMSTQQQQQKQQPSVRRSSDSGVIKDLSNNGRSKPREGLP